MDDKSLNSLDSENGRIDNCDCLNELNIEFDHDPSLSPLDMKFVCDSFRRSIGDKPEIDLCLYLQAYSELIKFFNMFGGLFTFVTKDVHSKIEILESYANDDNHGDHYRTIAMMIDFERNQNLLIDQKRPSGSRTLLRLHRALEFISIFLME
ncbi:glycolipid transfer protein domain-containing protein 1-like, partial [Euroglyphus maynei]